MRYRHLFIILSCFILSWRKNRSNDLMGLVLAHAPKINGMLLKLHEDEDIRKMPPLDTIFISSLSKLGVLQPDRYKSDGCLNSLYYYGYFDLGGNYTGAVFAYSVCSCCGDDQLILAIMDKHGTIVSAVKAAELTRPSECRNETTTAIKGTRLIVASTEECAILEGTGEGLSNVDSITSFYEITQTGKLDLQKRDSVNIRR